MHQSFHQELWRSIKEARMVMLKECALDVVKKATMPMGVQRSVRELGPVMRDYIASSVEKTNILPVGVKKRMIINCMAKVPIVLRSVRCPKLASLPRQMIRVPQPDRNAINFQCPISIPHRVAKISKTERSNRILFKSRYQGTKEVLQKVDQRS